MTTHPRYPDWARFWIKRLVIRDHQRDVLLGRIPSAEGTFVYDGPYDSADEAVRHLAANGPQMDYESELVKGAPFQA